MADPDLQTKLVCVECGKEAEDGAPGWRAHLTDGENEPEQVAIYCPNCAREEFDD